MHNYYNIYVFIITKIQNTLITSAIAAGYATVKPIYIDDFITIRFYSNPEIQLYSYNEIAPLDT